TTQRLLSDERVRPDASSMDLLFDKVVQFKHVHHAYRHIFRERFAGHTVKQGRLTARRELGNVQHAVDIFFTGAVENRRRKMDTLLQLSHDALEFRVTCLLEVFIYLGRRVNLADELAEVVAIELIDVLLQLLTEIASSPTKHDFEDL